jgi:hypothetical protein
MLDAIDSIVGAFERSDGGYDVRELLAEEFRNNMRDSRSTVGTGRVGIVAKKAFQDHGTSIRTVRI